MTDPSAITLRGVAAGARALAPLALLMAPYGLAFGAAAAERGLSAAEATLMSAVVFSGAAQFAALGFDLSEGASLALVATAFALGARHVLYGAALAPRLGPGFRGGRLAAFAFLSDPNFADAEAALRRGEGSLGRLLGGGLMLWSSWTLCTAAGAGAGAAAGGLDRIGADAAMPAFFAAALAGELRESRLFLPVAAAGAAALLLSAFLPIGGAVLGGAVAGGIAGMFDGRR